MSLTKRELQESIIIIIERDGSHHVKIPNNDDLEFDRKAYNTMMNTMTVLDEPSFVLKTVLWIERKMQVLNAMLFGANA
jgi:hypothetical protein